MQGGGTEFSAWEQQQLLLLRQQLAAWGDQQNQKIVQEQQALEQNLQQQVEEKQTTPEEAQSILQKNLEQNLIKQQDVLKQQELQIQQHQQLLRQQRTAQEDPKPTPTDNQPLSNKASFLVCGTQFDVDRKYRLIKPIGHGAYGVVCSAENLENGEKVAIKKVTKAFSNLIETKRTLREVKLLGHFRHANCIRILDIMRPDSYAKFEDVYIVSELMNTDLHQIISSNQDLSDEHVQYFIYQILRGLKYIHSAHVLHRDLKPSNLLLNANCDLKICDFGLARVASPEENHQGFLTEYVATRWYRAPEIMLSWKEYTKAIDVWSVGCIMAEILGRKPLFPGRDHMHQLHLIIDILGTPSKEDTEYIASEKAKAYIRSLPHKNKIPFKKMYPGASDVALNLLESLLTFAPEKRITVEQALAHPYLALLHDPTDEPSAVERFDFNHENYACDNANTKETLKALLWQEAVHFHPDLSACSDAPPSSAALGGAPPAMASTEKKQEENDGEDADMGVSS